MLTTKPVCSIQFDKTSPNSYLEESFLFNKANCMQFLLDWALGLVVFGTDCSSWLVLNRMGYVETRSKEENSVKDKIMSGR